MNNLLFESAESRNVLTLVNGHIRGSSRLCRQRTVSVVVNSSGRDWTDYVSYSAGLRSGLGRAE